jgi:hypothetical protein
MVAIMVAFLQASNHAFIDRPRCRDAQRMAIQTSFAKKVAWSQDRDHRFLALLGNDGELDLALLNVKKPRPRPVLAKKQFDPSDILISFFPRLLWREIFWDRTGAFLCVS